MLFVLSRVLPFFLIIGAGGLAARLKLLDAAAAQGLSRYVYWIGFPALLIFGLSHAAPPSLADARGLGAYVAAAALPLLLTIGLGRALNWPREVRAGAAMAATVGNTAFLGLPLTVSVLGEDARSAASAIMAIDAVILLSCSVGVIRGAGALKSVAGNPVVVAALVGAIMLAAGLVLPGPIDAAAGALAATASPVALVALGAVLTLEAGHAPRAELPPVAWAAASKLLVSPALVWIATGLVGASAAFRTVAVLMAACPTAVTVFVQARAYGVFARGAAQVVALATLASAVTLTLLAGWLTA
ncbi:AEC family transporter [Caulobacter sp. 17J80-11]|uniref:AEC family transporter n=1 Tax=Caulobacter sp. 17J80-11 TaxID=2763502 RepID=UPI001653C9F8|nr:AEC family transporter [Caulobacter sp. 17J80-11]MBC6982348.1 AEC family transporter [Caulobacter sp. 17J80-11]